MDLNPIGFGRLPEPEVEGRRVLLAGMAVGAHYLAHLDNRRGGWIPVKVGGQLDDGPVGGMGCT